MLSTLQNALPFFTKWKNECTRLDIIVSAKAFSVKFNGSLAFVSEQKLIAFSEPIGSVLRVWLSDAVSFEFTDSSEASMEVRSTFAEHFVQVWNIRFLDGSEVALYELRSVS